MTVELDDLDELTGEIRRLIESNKAFLEKVDDEDYDDEDEPLSEGPEGEQEDPEDFEEL